MRLGCARLHLPDTTCVEKVSTNISFSTQPDNFGSILQMFLTNRAIAIEGGLHCGVCALDNREPGSMLEVLERRSVFIPYSNDEFSREGVRDWIEFLYVRRDIAIVGD